MNEGQSWAGIEWTKFDDIEGLAARIRRDNGVSEFLAKCLARLEPALGSADEVRAFLSPELSNYYDPYAMLNMDKAVYRLRQAIDAHERIRIVTDYDVDGTMSSLILQATLKVLGHTSLSYHIPHRQLEGYGFSMLAAEAAVSDGMNLIVTADIGVRDVESIRYAQSHGVDVIVLDHHLPEGCGVPADAYAVVCPPQEGCSYPNPNLAACGIALKLAQAMLAGRKNNALLIRSLSKLAALGTIADVVSLRDIENRAIVSVGLRALNGEIPNNPGLSALLRVSKMDVGQVDASAVAFGLAPRINAAGRLSTATRVIELLNAGNSVQAQTLADELGQMNEVRKQIQEAMVERAREALESERDKPLLFVAFEEGDWWKSGIVGIVAGRLKEHFQKSVAVGTIGGGEIVCSMRTTPGVHAVEALNSVAKHLQRYGGHRAAAGFTLKVSEFECVKSGLCASAESQLCGKAEVLREMYVETLTLEDIDAGVFEDLDRLEPCGTKNGHPNICLDAVEIGGTLCKNGSVRCVFHCDGGDLTAWIPSCLSEKWMAEMGQKAKLFGTLEKDYFRGSVQRTFRVKDVILD